MISPGKAAVNAIGRRPEMQALVAVVPCGRNRGLAGIKLAAQTGSPSGEYFVPFAVGADPSDREYAYAGLTAAIDRLRDLKIERALIVLDDEKLVEELERRAEPPRELFLQYVILGCKLNEFRRAKVVSATSSRMEQLRARTESLAATVYSAPHPLAHAI
jgi:hypothetical protein